MLKIIESINPYTVFKHLKHRQTYRMTDRGSSLTSTLINDEAMIQRFLFKQQEYREILGTLIGYEVSIPYNVTPDYRIDLIGVKLDGDDLVINLIELKKCSLGEKK